MENYGSVETQDLILNQIYNAIKLQRWGTNGWTDVSAANLVIEDYSTDMRILTVEFTKENLTNYRLYATGLNNLSEGNNPIIVNYSQLPALSEEFWFLGAPSLTTSYLEVLGVEETFADTNQIIINSVIAGIDVEHDANGKNVKLIVRFNPITYPTFGPDAAPRYLANMTETVLKNNIRIAYRTGTTQFNWATTFNDVIEANDLAFININKASVITNEYESGNNHLNRLILELDPAYRVNSSLNKVMLFGPGFVYDNPNILFGNFRNYLFDGFELYRRNMTNF